MCRCCQSCLETCYWHLIYKRFCYDESIALYEEPVPPGKDEKNNNMFDNLTFYDNVSILAGRAVVTIDPIPQKIIPPAPVIVEQPRPAHEDYLIPKITVVEAPARTLGLRRGTLSTSMPVIFTEEPKNEDISSEVSEVDSSCEEDINHVHDQIEGGSTSQLDNLQKSQTDSLKKSAFLSPSMPEVAIRKKSLRERRGSKSLHLKIDRNLQLGRIELPVIHQTSMPTFYLNTPLAHQMDSPLVRIPSTALASPVPVAKTNGFAYDLHSVVQMERERATQNVTPSTSSGMKLTQLRDKMKLRRVKSTLSNISLYQSHHI